MRILVKYMDQNTSTINIRTFFDWAIAIPFIGWLHEKHLFIDTKTSYI